MYQTVGHGVIDLYAEALGLPLFRKAISGKSLVTELNYECNEDDEVEDLHILLKDIQVYRNFIFEVVYGSSFDVLQDTSHDKLCSSNFV